MYMTHNAKSLSQGLWEFPENENTTFLAIRGHQSLTAAGIIKRWLCYWCLLSSLMLCMELPCGCRQGGCPTPRSFLRVAEGSSVNIIKLATLRCQARCCQLTPPPRQWSPERWPGTPCTSLDGAPCLWPTATQFQNLDRFVRDGVTFALICHPTLPMKSTYCPSWRLIFLAPNWPSMPNDAGSLSHTATLPCPVLLAHLKALYLRHLEATKASELTLRVVNKPDILETQPTWSMLLGCDLKHGIAFVLTSQRLEFQVLQASTSALEFWVPILS